MERVTEFLAKNRTIFFATSENQQPRVRAFGYIYTEGKDLILCTANTKDVYHQLQANPRVELAAIDPQMNTLRVTGSAHFIQDKQIKQRVLDEEPLVKSIYQSADNPVFEVFRVEVEKVKFLDLMKQKTDEYTP